MEKQKTICEVCKGEFINIGSHMKAHIDSGIKIEESIVTDTDTQSQKMNKTSEGVTLFNTSGQPVSPNDYFFNGVIQKSFTKIFGKPVDREDMLSVFNKIFKASDNFLFYKSIDKEVYIIIVPIKYSTTIGEAQNSLDGDFQKHAISFINEGSVNLDTLRMKLEKIIKFCKFDNR